MGRSITTESFSVLTSEVNIFMLTSEVEVKIEAKTKWRSDLNREQVDILPQKNPGHSFNKSQKCSKL